MTGNQLSEKVLFPESIIVQNVSFSASLYTLFFQIVVRKGQKYVLVLHIVELNDEPSEPNKCLDLVFDETKFVTVNCHQNQVLLSITRSLISLNIHIIYSEFQSSNYTNYTVHDNPKSRTQG